MKRRLSDTILFPMKCQRNKNKVGVVEAGRLPPLAREVVPRKMPMVSRMDSINLNSGKVSKNYNFHFFSPTGIHQVSAMRKENDLPDVQI